MGRIRKGVTEGRDEGRKGGEEEMGFERDMETNIVG